MIFRELRLRRLLKKRTKLVNAAHKFRTHWCGTPHLECLNEIKKVDKKLVAHLPQEIQNE